MRNILKEYAATESNPKWSNIIKISRKTSDKSYF